MRSRAVVTLASVLALAAPLGTGAPGGAVGADGTRPPGRTITLCHDCTGSAVTVVDRRGTATAVWATHWWRGPVMAARRAPGERWTEPVQIGYGTGPEAVVDAAGRVTVVYSTNRRGFTTGLSAVRRSPGGPWTRPVHLTVDRRAEGYGGDGDEGSYGAHRSDVAVSPSGDVVVAWQWGSYDRDKPFRIEVVRRPAGSYWQGPVALTPRHWQENPEVGVDAAGRATVVYGADRGLVSRTFVPGSGWGAPLSAGTEVPVGYDLLVTPAGRMVLAVHHFLGGRRFAAAARERRPAGPWGRPRILSRDRGTVADVVGIVDGSGTPVVAWTTYHGRVAVARRGGAHWSPPVTLAGPSRAHVYDPRLAVDAAGDLAVTWDGDAPAPTRARVRLRTGHWTRPFTAWPNHGYYDGQDTALYPDGDLLALAVARPKLLARRVPLP